MDLFDMIVLVITYFFIIKILMTLDLQYNADFVREDNADFVREGNANFVREGGRREIIRLSTTPREMEDNFISIKDMFGTYFITINEIKSPETCYVKNGGYFSYMFCYSSPEQSCLTRFTPLRGFHKENVLCRVENDKLYFYYTPYPQNDTNEFRFYSVTFNKM
jgi:hypothetical protein